MLPGDGVSTVSARLVKQIKWQQLTHLVNLPIGGVAVIVIVFALPASLARSDKGLKGLTWWQTFLKFNPFGAILILGSIICLLLALQWGGAEYPWDSGRVIAVLVVFAVTLIIWIVLQYFQGDEATVPFSVAKQRSVAGAAFYSVCMSAAVGTVIFYMPIWYVIDDTNLAVPLTNDLSTGTNPSKETVLRLQA